MNVWISHRDVGGHWIAGNGWTQVLPTFGPFSELLERIRGAGIGAGRIRKLGIVAHGGRAGQPATGEVHFDDTLSAETISQHAGVLTSLTYFLSSEAVLIFFSCTAAATDVGTSLLTAVSSVMGQRRVVGFITYLHGASGVVGDTMAGNIRDSLSTVELRFSGRHLPRIHEDSPSAKVAQEGHLVRMPNYREIWRQVLRHYANSEGRRGSFVDRVYEEFIGQEAQYYCRNRAQIDAYQHAYGIYDYQLRHLLEQTLRGRISQACHDYGQSLHPEADLEAFYARRYLDQ